jgi:hypothetical protein
MRSRAYGRAMRALDSRSALERLSPEERETLRDAADMLVLARSSDTDSSAALAAARAILVSIRRDRIEPWIEQLADDLEDAGPAPITPFATPDLRATEQPPGRQWR